MPEENGFNMALQSSANSSLEWPAANKSYNSSMDFKQVRACWWLFNINCWDTENSISIFIYAMVPGVATNGHLLRPHRNPWYRCNLKCLKISLLEFPFCWLCAFSLSIYICVGVAYIAQDFILFWSNVLACGLDLLLLSTLLFPDISAACWIGFTLFMEI